jgi:integrase
MLSVRMPRLKQRKGGSYTARIKIPPDLRDAYAKRFGKRWSLKASWPKALSAAEANVKFAEWVKATNARFDALRAATAGRLRTLEHREVHGLVGRWYTDFVSAYESNPGDPLAWEAALEALDDEVRFDPDHTERSTDSLLSDPAILVAVRDDVARATKADAWLLDHGYALSPDSRAAFIDALAPRYADALELLIRRARGDYSRDRVAETFPTLEMPAKTGNGAVSIAALFKEWIAETRPARGTISRWQPVIDAAEKRWPDLRRVTDDDARQWLKGLITVDEHLPRPNGKRRSAGTVNATWRTAVKTICNWAINQGLLKDNPFARAKVTVPRKITTRESKAFTDSEAATILRAALAVEIRTPIDPGRRWLPWLCAYSGARGGEIAQLRGQDIAEREGIWAMILTPEAGTIKNRKPRSVPLHEHIIAQGFLDFVRSRGKGPLFYDPRPGEQEREKTQAAHVVQKVGEWVRTLGVNDLAVRPNHGWRHLFKLIAERANVPERLSDVITGHAPASVGRAYGQPTLSDLAREIKKLPRYEV